MKNSIKIFLGLFAIGIMLTFTACENYLEFPRVLSFNEDSIFVKRINTEKFLAQMYSYNYAQMPFQTSRLDRSLLDAASDIGSGLYIQSAYGAHKFNKGTALPEWISNDPSNMGEDIYSKHYVAIRNGWKLLARTDEVPDATKAQKDRIKGEAKTLIAMHYFELMKRYGGVPLVKKAFESTGESVVPRASFEETYKYIVSLCDEIIAMPNFPVAIPLSATNDFGRASKALAMGLKARALLFAASPLFNNTTPYMDNLGSNSNLICLMKTDNELWKQAADAAKATIDSCELIAGYALTNVGDVNKNYTAAYTYLPSKGNTEMIMPYLLNSSYLNNFKNWKPRGDNFSGFSSNVPTQNFIEMFQTKTGTYRSWDTDTITPVNDPTYPYKNLDPRFNQLIAYNGYSYPELPAAVLQIWDAANGVVAQGGVNGRRNNAQFAHYLHKYIYGYVNNTDFGVPNNWRPYTAYMRLTEMYLNLAEALNEYGNDGAKPNSEVYARINAIRGRSGMPDVDETVFNTKEKMRTLIQNERAIEIGFEDTRFFDLKRWKMGDTFKGPIYDLKVTKLTNNKYTYKKYIYEVRPWFIHYYLHPFPPSEVNKQKGIIQNPGW